MKDKNKQFIDLVKAKDLKKIKALKKDKEFYKDFVDAHKPNKDNELKQAFKNRK